MYWSTVAVENCLLRLTLGNGIKEIRFLEYEGETFVPAFTDLTGLKEENSTFNCLVIVS
jgi:hypothetical protein